MRHPDRVLFLVGAGPAVGLGHLSRSLALAAAFRDHDVECVFLVDGVEDRAIAAGFRASHADAPEPAAVLEVARAEGASLVICDSYAVDGSYLAALREGGSRVAAVDDLARFPFSCHFVVNGSVGAEHMDYRSSSGDTRFLLGAQFALLRPEFVDVPEPVVRDRVERVLVSVGGTDLRGVLPRLIEALDTLPRQFEVDVVVGPYADPAASERAALGSRHRLRLVSAPASVVDLFASADVVVSAAGQTIYELLRLGVPTVAIQTATNQAFGIQRLSEAGLVRFAGSVDEPGWDQRAVTLLGELVDDAPMRRHLSALGRRTIDGQGPRRVASALLTGEEEAG